MGEAQFHDGMIGIRAFARPRPETRPKTMHDSPFRNTRVAEQLCQAHIRKRFAPFSPATGKSDRFRHQSLALFPTQRQLHWKAAGGVLFHLSYAGWECAIPALQDRFLSIPHFAPRLIGSRQHHKFEARFRGQRSPRRPHDYNRLRYFLVWQRPIIFLHSWHGRERAVYSLTRYVSFHVSARLTP